MEEGPGWSSNLNPVLKCLHMSEFGLDLDCEALTHSTKVSPLGKASCAELTLNQSSACVQLWLLLSHYQ